MEEINLIERDGVLLDEKEMKIGARLFAYNELFGSMSLVEINENEEVVVLTSTTLPKITESLTSFKQFLNLAEQYCKNNVDCNYESLWDCITINDPKTLENLQKANSEQELNQSKESEINLLKTI